MATETCCPYLAQRNGSIESWLFHRDPYFMVFNSVIPMDKTCEPMIRLFKAGYGCFLVYVDSLTPGRRGLP